MQHRPPAMFVADSAGLDFLNSIATPLDAPVDWIDSGDGLLAWLQQAGLVSAELLGKLRADAMPGELDSVAAQARSLREWFRGFVKAHMGRRLTAEDLTEIAPLNRLLERDNSYRQIVVHDEGGEARFELANPRRWGVAESLLLPIGESLARLVCEEDFSQIKACEGDHCTLMFADHTRGRARRWCSMAVCGNRAKQAGFRNRARARHSSLK